MYFILKEESDKDRAIGYIQHIQPQRKTLVVDIKPYKLIRTSCQNRLYWKWIDIIAHEFGNTKDEMHDIFRVRLLPLIEREVEGVSLREPASTAKLTTTQFAEYLTKIEILALSMGITLPHPDDYFFIMNGKMSSENAQDHRCGGTNA